MGVCDCKGVCDFYNNLTSRLGLAVFFLTQYCHGPFFRDCARHVVHSWGGAVPPDLYPNQTGRATSILGKTRENVEAGS